jgi:hypothetical protein
VKTVSQLTRRFRVAFDDAKVVAHAGLVFPLRLADGLGLRERVNRTVSGQDRAGRRNSGHKVLQLVAMLAAGGEFISDVAVVAAGATLRRLGYRSYSESRLGQWLRSLHDADIAGLADATTEVTAAAWAQGLGPDLEKVSVAAPLIIDLDSTVTETYGAAKEGAGDRNYKGVKGYHPLLAVEASTGQVIAAELRAGNTSPANGAADFVTDTLGRLHRLAARPVPTLIRADSGFYLRDLFDECQKAKVSFSVTVRVHQPTRRIIEGIGGDAWRPLSASATRRVDIAEVPFTIKGRNEGRAPIPVRLIVRRYTTPADSGDRQLRLFDLVDYHAFVTDQQGDPADLWRRHNQRAGIETTIRDLKYGLALNHFPSGKFIANAAWLHLNTLTHNLLRATNRVLTPQPLTAKLLRYRYLAVPGRITAAGHTTILHLPQNWPHQHHITRAHTRLQTPTAA